MADSSNSFQIPWASLAVVATFVSGTLLMPQAFDLLRPPEKERAQPTVGSELEVDARLWEDPFAAVRRYEAERTQRCEKVSKDTKSEKEAKSERNAKASHPECDRTALAERRAPKVLLRQLDFALILAVMVPGNPFVGAEEARRRTRYAVNSGLLAEGFVPASPEHIGLLSIDVSAQGLPAQAANLLVPYELMSPGRGTFNRAVAVLWIDESALPSPKLDGLAFVLQAVFESCQETCPKLALFGPSSSDGLRSAVQRLNEVETPNKTWTKASTDAAKAGLRRIAQASAFNTAATLPDRDLGIPEQWTLEKYLKYRLKKVAEPKEPTLTYERTLAPDDKIVTALATELQQRLDASRPRRVVTIIESDTVFPRSLDDQLRMAIGDAAAPARPNDRVYFFRGVDGMTIRDGNSISREGAARANDKKDDASTAVEWPESRDQLDYLRRMAAELRRSETVPFVRNGKLVAEPIGAFGIFANDVHDKLLILQALHETFPDKVFFTSDMDARFLHPRTLPFTRNLIVASSLPLQFPIVASDDGANGQPPVQMHAPFRDVYQTSTYAATRLAVCAENRCDSTRNELSEAIAEPSVYEIGRDRTVALAGYDFRQRRAREPQQPYTIAVVGGTVLLLVGLLVWPSTPTLRLVRRAVSGTRLPGDGPASMSPDGLIASTVLVGMYAFVLGVLLASIVEVLQPARLNLADACSWGLIAAVAAVVMYRGLRRPPPPVRIKVERVIVTLLVVALLLWFAWAVRWPSSLSLAAAPSHPSISIGEPLVWLQGVSGWPSHFVNLVAVLSGLIALDLLWDVARRAGDDETRWLALPNEPRVEAMLRRADGAGDSAKVDEADAPSTGTSAAAETDAITRVAEPAPCKLHKAWAERMRATLARWRRKIRQRKLIGWQPAADARRVDVAILWRQYETRSSGRARLMRILFWFAVAVGSILLLFSAFSGQTLPGVPVRSAEHRNLIATVMIFAAVIVLPFVVAAVADATMLAWRLIRHLSSKRSAYPAETVQRFARQLGLEAAQVWGRAIEAEPEDRAAGKPVNQDPPHSLLDDLLDIRLIARVTDKVAPLVLAPFVMLTLLVLARSRLFDNWALTWPIVVSAALYVVWLGLLAVMLKQAAEGARVAALRSMNADLHWLQGGDAMLKALVEPMQRLIAGVESERRGAFAAPFDQWFFKGLLVPLGGAGGVQLIERLLMAR